MSADARSVFRHPMPDWLHELDHTGDAGFDVGAPALDVLFARAAWALFTVLTDPDAVEPHETKQFTVEAPDREALLVRWLTELNYVHSTGGWLFSRFDVHLSDDGHLTATVQGEPYDPERHTIYTEIKAVTFHGLRIEQQPDGWRARIIFDL